MQQIEILVISLESAEVRRRLMRAQLELPGMPPYRFVDAVDGRAALSDETGAPRRVRQALSALEIACARSHLAAYKSIADQQIPVALVFEDDALLGYQFLQVIDRLLPLVDPARPQAILLSHVERYSAWAARRVDKIHHLYRPYEAYGAHAYLITLAGARSMIAASARVRTPADDWLYFMKAGILEVAALVPYLVGTSPLSTESQLGNWQPQLPEGRWGPWLWKYLWQKFLFQLLARPVLRLRRNEQTW
jgi:glycosyl transferase, family 25